MTQYDYTICKDNSPQRFREACARISGAFPEAQKKLLIDVDGSTIQAFTADGLSIRVYDDYEIGAVFVTSDVNLASIFASTKEIDDLSHSANDQIAELQKRGDYDAQHNNK